MNDKTKTGLEILQSAVLLGILGDVLLRRTPWGLNVLLFVVVLVAAFAMLVLRRRRDLWNAQTIALNAAMIFFAAMFAWRDSGALKFFDVLAILMIPAVLILPSLHLKTQAAGVFHYAAGFVWAGINAAFAPFFLLFSDISWKSIPQTGWSKQLISVLRGLLIAAPLLMIFGALFMAADAVFEGLVRRTLNIDAEVLFSHVFLIGFFSWTIAGYLRGALVERFAGEAKQSFIDKNGKIISVTEIGDEETPKTEENPQEKKKIWSWQNLNNSFLPNSLTLGAIEISIVLGLINLLFLSFVIVQIPYLFGGLELVRSTPDFKLAEYARRGFGELVTVSALVLPILLISHWLLRRDAPLNEKIYRALAAVQIILLFVIMASAAQRLFILTGNLGYGLTTVRFYPMVMMVWLALLFVWFVLTVLRGAREQFAWGALWLALIVLGGLHFANPDDYIVRTNLRLMREGREFDAVYNANLSADAVPALLEGLPSMNFEQQCIVKNKLLQLMEKAESENDFRSWSFSRRLSQKALKANAENFDTSNCPAYTKSYFYSDFH
jgi:hypothetical protein